MPSEEQEQIQNVIQAACSLDLEEEVKSLLETIDVRLYGQVFKAALSSIYEHPQTIYSGIRRLIDYLEESPAPYTAEDIRAILQLFNELLKLMPFGQLLIFPLPPSFEPHLMQPEVFAFCQSEIVACYWAAFHWSQTFFTKVDQYRQILLVGDALLGDAQPGVPGLLRRYTKGSNLPLEEQAQEFFSVHCQEIHGRSWILGNHELRERLQQAISAPLKVRIIREALKTLSTEDFAHFNYQPEHTELIEMLSSDPLPATTEDIQDILQYTRKALFHDAKTYYNRFRYPQEMTFYTLLTVLSPYLHLPETLESCRREIEDLYHGLSNARWSVADSPVNRIRLLLRQILFPKSAGPLMDYLQASGTSFVTDHDAQTLLQTYHQEYASGSIDKLDPSFALLFKQNFSPHFTVRLIRLAVQEIAINYQPGQYREGLYVQNFTLIKALCKKELPFTPDDIHAILDTAKSLGAFRLEMSHFHLFLMKTLVPHLTRPEVLERCYVELEELQAMAPSLIPSNKAMRRTYFLMITDILSARQQTINYPLLPDAWAKLIIDELMALEEGQQGAWATLLRYCARAKDKAPSAAWLEQAKVLIEPIGNASLTLTVHRWISLFSDEKDERMDDSNSTILRGLIWLCTGSEDHSLANILADAAIEGYRKIPGLGPRSPKLGDAAVTTLAHMPGVQAIGQLERVRLHVKQPSYRRGIEQALDEVARRKQMSRSDPKELKVPTFDLTNVHCSTHIPQRER